MPIIQIGGGACFAGTLGGAARMGDPIRRGRPSSRPGSSMKTRKGELCSGRICNFWSWVHPPTQPSLDERQERGAEILILTHRERRGGGIRQLT